MPLDSSLKERIESIIGSDDVVLFMKGNKMQPMCGFSASVIDVLNEVGVGYTTFNVLEDPEIRDGIKVFSNWPTIPQLYVRGELQGGADIVREMYAKGELHKVLGVTAREAAAAPTIEVTKAAIAALLEAKGEDDPPHLRLKIDAAFRHNMHFDKRQAADVEIELGEGLTLVADAMSARRANGVKIDYVEGPAGSGFKIDNPGAPPKVQEMTVRDLKSLLDAGEDVELIDVRTEGERSQARIEPSRLFDDSLGKEIEAMPKDTRLVFYCHTGARSRSAAEYFLRKGFTNVHNVVGGVDAWSREIDSSVARY